jgi:hypothetical protein
MGTLLTFGLDWPQTANLPFSSSQVSGITEVNHYSQLYLNISKSKRFNIGNLLLMKVLVAVEEKQTREPCHYKLLLMITAFVVDK